MIPATNTDSLEEYTKWKMALLVTFNMIVILIGILGNSFILYTAMRCREVLAGCQATLLLIKHLTISDLLCLIFLGIPALTFYLCMSCNVVTMCFYTNYVRPALTSANFKFVFLVSLLRLFRCIRPRSAMTIQPFLVEVCAVMVYVVSAGESVLSYITLRHANFSLNAHGCHVELSDTVERHIVVVRFIHIGVAMVIPFVGTIIANVLLWAVACRTTHKLDMKPVIAVSVMSGMILVSWLPFIVYMFQRYILHTEFNFAEMEEVAFNLVLLSVASNPIIYTVFNKSLRDYLVARFRRLVRFVMGPQPVGVSSSVASSSNIAHPR